jgi:hypothetical protein
LNGLMMAVTSFMRTSISWRNRCHARSDQVYVDNEIAATGTMR